MINLTEKDGVVIFDVRVVPRSSKSEIVGELGGALKIKIKSPPVDGAANAELVKVLARFFDVPKSAVAIRKGHAAKNKQIEISNLSIEKFRQTLNLK